MNAKDLEYIKSLLKEIDEWKSKYLALGEKCESLVMENFELKQKIKPNLANRCSMERLLLNEGWRKPT